MRMNRTDKLRYDSLLRRLDFSSVPGVVTAEIVNIGDDAAIAILCEAAHLTAPISLTEVLPPPHIMKDRLLAIEDSLCQCLKRKIISQTEESVPTYDIMLVDGNNLAHKIYNTHKLSFGDINTSVKFGVLRSLCSYYEKFNKPGIIVVCFDDGIPPGRFELVPDYKSNRKIHPDEQPDPSYVEVRKQIGDLVEWLPLFGIITTKVPNYEADDVVSYYCSNLDGKKVVISGDADYLQLVNHDVDVYIPGRRTIVTESTFFHYMAGIRQESFLLWKALVGDSSDNIPGVKGIGTVTAEKIVGLCPTLQALRLTLLKGGKVLTPYEVKLIKDAGGIGQIRKYMQCMDLTKFQPECVDDYEHHCNADWASASYELTRLGFESLKNRYTYDMYTNLCGGE